MVCKTGCNGTCCRPFPHDHSLDSNSPSTCLMSGDKTDVRFVDTHSKGNCSHHYLRKPNAKSNNYKLSTTTACRFFEVFPYFTAIISELAIIFNIHRTYDCPVTSFFWWSRNKLAAANFLWLHFLNNRSSIQPFFCFVFFCFEISVVKLTSSVRGHFMTLIEVSIHLVIRAICAYLLSSWIRANNK